MSTEDFDTLADGDDEVFAGLRRSVGAATLATSAADVAALGRRTRNRHRALAAGIGTSAAAIVAAIGVLVPSAGPGAGTAPKLAQGPLGVTTTTIQDSGFTLEEHGDGTVLLSLSNAFDAAKLQAALERVGIPAAILVRQLPDGWDLAQGGIRCTPDPGVHGDLLKADKILKNFTSGPSPKLVLNKAEIPAGDYITLERFESHGRFVTGSFSLQVGRQTTCVPEHWSASAKSGQ